MTRGPARAAVAALLLVPLTGCSPFGDDGATRAADSLASALAQHDVSGIRFTQGDGATSLRPVLEPLASYSSTVKAGDVHTDGARATATLHWVTDLGGGTWERDGSVALRRSHDTWQVVAAPGIVDRALHTGEHLSVETLPATRGRILGEGGAVLVEPRPVLRIGIDKTKAPQGVLATSARRLADRLGLDPGRLAKAVRAAGPRAFVEALVVRASDPVAQQSGWRGIPGVVGLPGELPLAPTREFARQLLGVVGPVDAEVLKESKGRLRPGDETGLSGLQRRYDQQLFGETGTLVEAVSTGNTHHELFRVDAHAGADLRTSLDRRLQQRADDLLQHTGSASALVAIRPRTGAIVAAASGPADNGYDTATFGRYPPGSTFKIVSSLALLRAGLHPDSRVRCPPRVTVDGKSFKNYSDYPPDRIGTITLADAVANSCNTAFVGSRSHIHGDALSRAATDLGLGVDHDVGFPAYFGQVPAPASQTEAAADLIGQGRVTASPMAMATVLASVLHGGTVVPWLLPDHRATVAGHLTAAEATALHTLLRRVVTDGSGRGLAGLGGDIIAKTGTAEFGDASKTHAWMVGGNRDLAVAVFVDEGESGSGTAGPILRDFLSSALVHR